MQIDLSIEFEPYPFAPARSFRAFDPGSSFISIDRICRIVGITLHRNCEHAPRAGDWLVEGH